MPKISAFSAYFPPPPLFTDANLPSLTGRVYLITGAAGAVGSEVVKFLYLAGATVYLGCRSLTQCTATIEEIKQQTRDKQARGEKPEQKGRLEALEIDLADLESVRSAAGVFSGRENRLDGLVHNAAVMNTPEGQTDKQGHDLEIGTNCLGPYLLTLCLEDLLVKTAALEGVQNWSVRIVWVVALQQLLAHPGGMDFDSDGVPVHRKGIMQNYAQSKSGATWLATKFAEKLGSKGIMSTSLHPGVMPSPLQRHMGFGGILFKLFLVPFLKPPVYGAYSELYAVLSTDIPASHNGGHLLAWGRLSDYPDQLSIGMQPAKDGGQSRAQMFFDYCDREVKAYL